MNCSKHIRIITALIFLVMTLIVPVAKNCHVAYQHNRREELSEYVSHGYMPTHCPETLQNPDIEIFTTKMWCLSTTLQPFP